MAERHVIVVDGPDDDAARHSSTGFLAASGRRPTAVVYGSDLPLVHESIGERLRALLPGGRHEALLLADTRLAAALASASARRRDDLETARRGARAARRGVVHVHGRDAVTRGRCDASTRSSPRSPAGVTLVDEEREEIDPVAHGVDLYVPAHEYTFRARGRITGVLDGVVAIHRELRDTDFVTVEPVHLEERPLHGS